MKNPIKVALGLGLAFSAGVGVHEVWDSVYESLREGERAGRQDYTEAVATITGFDNPVILERGAIKGVYAAEMRYNSKVGDLANFAVGSFCFVLYESHPEDNSVAVGIDFSRCG